MARPETLFVTEAQCAERLGLSLEQFKSALPALNRGGFPMPDPLLANRRYWPAVWAWCDRRYGIGGDHMHSPYPPDEQEPWKNKRGVTAPPGLDGKENWK